MCTKQLLTANTGIVTISTANSNRDGTGTLGTAFTAGTGGSKVKSFIIKATGTTTEGMIRFYIASGGAINLYKEIFVPAVTQTGVVPAFEWVFADILNLNSGDTIRVSTEKAETFNIIVNGEDITNCACTDNSGPIYQSVAQTGLAKVTTANANLNGTGTMSTAVTSPPSAGGASGLKSSYANIKALQTTTDGMIRFFINNGVSSFLFSEVRIPATTRTAIEPTFRTTVFMGLYLQPGYSIRVSTQNSEIFTIITLGTTIFNCPCI